MNKLLLICGLSLGIAFSSPAQEAAKAAAAKPAQSKTRPPTKTEAKPDTKIPGFDLNAGTTGPITTEIFADEAFFDSQKNVGIFRGRVKVVDPRFNLQADKLTVFISKGATQGLEKAIAEGNVAVVRERPEPNGGPTNRAVGRAESAVYVATTGDVELKGTPRVQSGLNTHIGTSPETVMVINQSGQLTTRGPSRTDIRQEPKDDKAKDKDKGKDKDKEKEKEKSPDQNDSPPASPKP
ncbi:MAG TPA: LptA/OstA family protein [Chthoniobacterales bacterium]|nr:LptA/OstA family protein [Chthoniobacterales bacterium]